jgi:hypothetical protein
VKTFKVGQSMELFVSELSGALKAILERYADNKMCALSSRTAWDRYRF